MSKLRPMRTFDALRAQAAQVRELPLAEAKIVPRECIHPMVGQPRSHMDPAALAELRADVAVHGILYPLLVRALADNQYELIGGARRLLVAEELDLAEVPVRVLDVSEQDARVLALIDNVQREVLDDPDQGAFYVRLRNELQLDLRSLAELVGKKKDYVNLRILLVETPGAVEQWRAGLLKLHDLVTRLAPPAAAVPAGEPPEAAPTVLGKVAPGPGPLPTVPSADAGASATSRSPAAPRRVDMTRPFAKLRAYVNELVTGGVEVAPDQRELLNVELEQLIATLQRLQEQIQGTD